MLYCPGTATYTSNGTVSTTSGGAWCQCPNCGDWHRGHAIVEVSHSSNFGFDPEPIVPRDLPIWPRPISDVLQHRPPQPLQRNGFDRPGRELRHRGAFRNFHK